MLKARAFLADHPAEHGILTDVIVAPGGNRPRNYGRFSSPGPGIPDRLGTVTLTNNGILATVFSRSQAGHAGPWAATSPGGGSVSRGPRRWRDAASPIGEVRPWEGGVGRCATKIPKTREPTGRLMPLISVKDHASAGSLTRFQLPFGGARFLMRLRQGFARVRLAAAVPALASISRDGLARAGTRSRSNRTQPENE